MFSSTIALVFFIVTLGIMLLKLVYFFSDAHRKDQRLARAFGAKVTVFDPLFWCSLVAWVVSGTYLFG